MLSFLPNFETCDHISPNTHIQIKPKEGVLCIKETFPSKVTRLIEMPFSLPFSVTKGVFHDCKTTNTEYLEFTNVKVPYLKRKDRESVCIPVSSRISLLCSRDVKKEYGILFENEIESFTERARIVTIKRLRLPLFDVERWYIDDVNKAKRSKVLNHLHYENNLDSTFHMKGKADVEELVFNHPFTICLIGPNPNFPSNMVIMEQAIITEKKIVSC